MNKWELRKHITHEMVDTLLKNYSFYSPEFSFDILSGGYENISICLVIQSKKYLMRIYNSHQFQSIKREKEHLLFELEFIAHLKKHVIPTVEPYRTLNETQILEIDIEKSIHYCVLFNFIEGALSKKWNSRRIQTVALLQAQMHLAAKSFYTTYNRPHDEIRGLETRLFKMLKELKEKDNKNPVLQFLSKELTKISKELAILTQDQPNIAVHRDLHKGNLLYKNSTLQAILDFDDLACSQVAEDIGFTLFDICENHFKSIRNLQDWIEYYWEAYGKITTVNKKLQYTSLCFMIQRTIGECIFLLRSIMDKPSETAECSLKHYQSYLKKLVRLKEPMRQAR